jgi:hypothetical protein
MNMILKRGFYLGIAGISLFEILNVYFIMPLPGSQRMDSLNVAYFLYTNRWIFRILAGLLIAAGVVSAFKTGRRWLMVLAVVAAIFIIYLFNFQMTAEQMFRQPQNPGFKSRGANRVDNNSLVIGVEHNGTVKAYPVQFLAYHHQIQDTVGGLPLLVTYCSVCRSGRVYEPTVNGHHEKFRLVGMDHFNAMFEDATTGSWWRQATGEAVTGPQKGEKLPEVASIQFTIKKLFELYPDAQVMQVDEASKMEYDSLRRFEQGKSKSKLTRTDTISWMGKSWIIGIQIGGVSKAYDWNNLKQNRVINDFISEKPIVLALSADNQSFAAFERPDSQESFTIRNDTLYSEKVAYDFSGRSLTLPSQNLIRVNAYQEFWHSWRTFHPGTIRYQ